MWLDVLESDPSAFVYQTPSGLDAICAHRGHEDASRLYQFDDGRQLILPLFRRKGLPAWLSVERSPVVGSLVSPGPARPDELRAIFADLDNRRSLRTVVRPTALASQEWEAAAPPAVHSVRHMAHILDLEGGFEHVWQKRFNGQARRAVRKAEKADIQVERDCTGRLIPAFRDLLQRSVDRWAAQTREPRFLARLRLGHRDSIRGLQLMVEKLGEACRLWVASVDGRPAAAIVVLQGANAHYTRGAMDKDLAGPVRASFLLQKLAIEEACRSGCRYYNMGETGASGGLARFKSHFGARSYSQPEYYFERLPIAGTESRLRSLASKLMGPRSGARETQR